MKKDNLPFFSHDNNAVDHPKCRALIASHGFEGYGRFWAINERVAASPSGRLDLSRRVYRADLAVLLQMPIQALEEFLIFLADPEECGLVDYSDGIVTTERTTEDLNRLNDIRQSARDRKGTKRTSSPNSAESSANFASGSAKTSTDKTRVEESRKEVSAATGETPAADIPMITIPEGTTFSSSALAEFERRAPGRVQELLDVYARLKEMHGYRYASDSAAIRQFAAQSGGIVAWLDRASGRKHGDVGPPEFDNREPIDFDDAVDSSEIESILPQGRLT